MVRRLFCFLSVAFIALAVSACSRSGGAGMLAPASSPASSSGDATAQRSSTAAVAIATTGQTPGYYLLVNAGGAAAAGYSPDQDWIGTTSTGSDPAAIDVTGPNVANPKIYATYRTAATTLTYVIPNLYADAAYHGFLDFEEPAYTATGQRILNVTVGATTVSPQLDIFATAGKMHKAIGVAYSAKSDDNGNLQIAITAVAGTPILSGFSLYGPQAPAPAPSAPGAPEPPSSLIAINAGGAAIDGFSADNYWSGSSFSTTGVDMASVDVSGPNEIPAAVYSTYRTAPRDLSYRVPGLIANTAYHGFMYFEEPIYNAPGQRQLQVNVNATTITYDLDIFSAAGGMHKGYALPFNVKSDATGILNFDISIPIYDPVQGAPIISAIKIWGSPGANQTVDPIRFSSGISGVPEQLAAGPDGNIWFAETLGSGGAIGRMTTAGAVTEFSAGLSGTPVSITAGPDGNVWFVESNAAGLEVLGKITPGGTITEFATGDALPGGAGYVPLGGAITTGPDGNLWFTEPSAIGRMTPAGVLTEFATDYFPLNIVAGKDGNLWYTTYQVPGFNGTIRRITTTGAITIFPEVSGAPSTLTAGPDGNIWFTQVGISGYHSISQSQIGRITPQGTITEYLLSGYGSPGNIVTAHDGNMYFGGDSGLVRWSTAGTGATLYAQPQFLASGPDGNLWYIDASGGINKLHL